MRLSRINKIALATFGSPALFMLMVEFTNWYAKHTGSDMVVGLMYAASFFGGIMSLITMIAGGYCIFFKRDYLYALDLTKKVR